MDYKEKRIKELEAKLKKDTPLDIAHKEYHKKLMYISRYWNKVRLISLVTPELRLRFERAEQKFKNEVGDVSDNQKITLYNMMCRAYESLEEEANRFGFKKLGGDHHIVVHPNHNIKCYIVENEIDLPFVVHAFGNEPDTLFFSMKELLLTIDPDALELKMKFMKYNGNIIEYKKYEDKYQK